MDRAGGGVVDRPADEKTGQGRGATVARRVDPLRGIGLKILSVFCFVIMATMLGMALGGWMSGWIFDVTGSYRAAFLNGIGWNLLNLSIAGWLFLRTRAGGGRMVPTA